jgi:putative acetyltransferase
MAGFVTLDIESGHIDQLAVAPAFWSKGAAKALLDHAKRQSDGVLRLDVNQDNPRAVRFYEREHFRRRTAAANPMSGMKTWRYEWSGGRDT